MPPPPSQTKWWLRVTAILWFFLGLGSLLALPVLFDAAALLVIAAVLSALLIGAASAWLIRMLSVSSRTNSLFRTWLKSSLASFFILTMALAAPIYYFALNTAIKPALLPKVTMTDGKKTVIMQGMMHVGTESFYKSVVCDAERALSEGYVLYYEGVQPNPAADKWFSDTLAGGGDLSSNYRALGEICGLQFQLDYFGLLENDAKLHPEKHMKADVDALDMKQEYDRLMEGDPAFAAAMKDAGAQKAKQETNEGIASAIKWLKEGTEGQRRIAGFVCRWMLNRVGRGSSADRESEEIEKVILDFRNRKLADRILSEKSDKI